LAQAESLDLALQALSARQAGEQAPPRIEKLLREEFRRQAASSRRRVRWQLAVLGAAAALALALGVSLHQRAGRAHIAGAPPHAGPAQPVVTDAGSASTAGSWQAQAPKLAVPAESAAETEPSDLGSATDFVALPYADDAMAGDGGAIVRVVLSRPALASLGLPVTDLGATDRIPADIIVSEDGAPQAIRLVSQSNLDE
jgi:hypothetical protein